VRKCGDVIPAWAFVTKLRSMGDLPSAEEIPGESDARPTYRNSRRSVAGCVGVDWDWIGFTGTCTYTCANDDHACWMPCPALHQTADASSSQLRLRPTPRSGFPERAVLLLGRRTWKWKYPLRSYNSPCMPVRAVHMMMAKLWRRSGRPHHTTVGWQVNLRNEKRRTACTCLRRGVPDCQCQCLRGAWR
jgi:hypothetical protein